MLYTSSHAPAKHGIFLSFFFFIYIFSIFALSFANAKRKTRHIGEIDSSI